MSTDITIADVSMSFETPEGRKDVLQNVSYTVTPGHFVAIVGPSGVGKTTLLRILTGLTKPTSGTVQVRGHAIDGPPDGLAVVLQDYTRSLMPWLTVEKNIALPLRGRKMSKADLSTRISESLAEVGLEGTQKSYPWQLSGGMQQRVAIARALATRPDLLIMDEPFASVDAQTRFDLEDLVLKVRRDFGITTLMVTHDIDEAVYLSDEVVVLYGKPASVREVVEVDIPFPRSQIETRNDARFAELRTHVYSLVRGLTQPNEAA
ncbi:MAG: ABC transporter ATP-binding protein [Candidatus Nanopelagicales bacterium]|jgi:NitT/TauT family transport system ATP-binding protein